MGFWGFRRAQAAMEFLMTYGWAILVVLAAIGALSYFGVMNPGKFIPESCTLPSTAGLACIDFTVTSDSAHLFIANGGGRDLIINNISVGDCSAVFDTALLDSTKGLFNITGCDFGESGQKSKNTLVIHYTDRDSHFSKSVSGSVISTVS